MNHRISRDAYYEKLKDPRWQKMRLEVLSRDDWQCQLCGSKDATLHVHHVAYVPNGEPWDVDPGLLFTACAACHSQEHDDYRNAQYDLLRLLAGIGIKSSSDISLFIVLMGAEIASTGHRSLIAATGRALDKFDQAKRELIQSGEFWRRP